MTQAPPYAAPPRRRRPSGWWFVVGGASLVAAVAVGIVLVVWTLSGVFDIEDTVAADGLPHRISLSGTEERMLWGRPQASTDCAVVDTATGTDVARSPVAGSLDKHDGSGSWTGVSNFRPGSGDLEITCQAAGGPVQVGPATTVGSFVGKVLATVLAPLALGGFGFVTLLVTGILFATGEPRRRGDVT
jgi:hypothetical protein